MKKIEVVAGVIFNSDNKFLIAQRKGGQFDSLWEFPGGKKEGNETNEQTLIREIKEELDMNIEIKKYLTTVEYQYETFFLIMHVYECYAKNIDMSLLVHKDIKWIDIRESNSINWVPADIFILDKLK